MSKKEQNYNLNSLDKYIKEIELELEYDKQKNNYHVYGIRHHSIANQSLLSYPVYPIKINFPQQIQSVIEMGTLKQQYLQVIEPLLSDVQVLGFLEGVFWLAFATHFPQTCTQKVTDRMVNGLKDKYCLLFVNLPNPKDVTVELLVFFLVYVSNNIFYHVFVNDRQILTKQFMVHSFIMIFNYLYTVNPSDKYIFYRINYYFHTKLFFQQEYVKFELDFEKEKLNNQRKKECYNKLVPLLRKQKTKSQHLDFINDINLIFKKHDPLKESDIDVKLSYQEVQSKMNGRQSQIPRNHKKGSHFDETEVTQQSNHKESIKPQRNRLFSKHSYQQSQQLEHQNYVNNLYNSYQQTKKTQYQQEQLPKMNYNSCSPGFQQLQFNNKLVRRNFKTQSPNKVIEEARQVHEKQLQNLKWKRSISEIVQKEQIEVKQKLSDIYNLKYRDLHNTVFEQRYPEFKQYYKDEVITKQILQQHKTNYTQLNSSKKIIQLNKNSQLEEFVNDILNK